AGLTSSGCPVPGDHGSSGARVDHRERGWSPGLLWTHLQRLLADHCQGLFFDLVSVPHSADCRRAVATRPLYLPTALAFATPSRCRSSMISRSNSAKEPIRFSMSFPVGVAVSSCIARIRSSTPFTLSLEVIENEIGHGACQSVELGNDQDIALATEI